jgi:hypothetical protein
MKCNKTQGKWYKNKHGASKIIDTLETYHTAGKEKYESRIPSTETSKTSGVKSIYICNDSTGAKSKKEQKNISRQVNLAISSPPATTEYLQWSDQPVRFSRADHPRKVPRPGHSPMVLRRK